MRKSLTPKLGIQGLKSLDTAILAALATNATVLLIGTHGSAKTLLARRVAEKLGCTFRHYNTSLLNYDDLVGYSDIHPPLNSFLSGYQRVYSAKLSCRCLPAQIKLSAIVTLTKIIPNPFPPPSSDRTF